LNFSAHSIFLSLVLLIACGGLISAQATMNVALSRGLGFTLFVMIFSLIQLLFSLPVWFLWGYPAKLSTLNNIPIGYYISGALGVFVLIGMSYAMARTGTFIGTVALLLGQLLIGLLIDHFGLFSALQRPITFSKIFAIALILIGIRLSMK